MLCYVYPYHSGLLYWYWGNHIIATVAVMQPHRIWVNVSYKSTGIGNLTICLIIIKSEVWTIIQCLGLGHETMVCAVCLFIFLSQSTTKPGAIFGVLLCYSSCNVYHLLLTKLCMFVCLLVCCLLKNLLLLFVFVLIKGEQWNYKTYVVLTAMWIFIPEEGIMLRVICQSLFV